MKVTLGPCTHPPLICRKSLQNRVDLFSSRFSDNLASRPNSRKTGCVCVYIALRALLPKRHSARKLERFLKVLLSHFGTKVQFCAQARCVSPSSVFQHLEKVCSLVDMRVCYPFCLALVGPCAHRGYSNHSWEQHFDRIYEGFGDYVRKTFTARF